MYILIIFEGNQTKKVLLTIIQKKMGKSELPILYKPVVFLSTTSWLLTLRSTTTILLNNRYFLRTSRGESSAYSSSETKAPVFGFS